jgi:hypothetical protein
MMHSSVSENFATRWAPTEFLACDSLGRLIVMSNGREIRMRPYVVPRMAQFQPHSTLPSDFLLEKYRRCDVLAMDMYVHDVSREMIRLNKFNTYCDRVYATADRATPLHMPHIASRYLFFHETLARLSQLHAQWTAYVNQYESVVDWDLKTRRIWLIHSYPATTRCRYHGRFHMIQVNDIEPFLSQIGEDPDRNYVKAASELLFYRLEVVTLFHRVKTVLEAVERRIRELKSTKKTTTMSTRPSYRSVFSALTLRQHSGDRHSEADVSELSFLRTDLGQKAYAMVIKSKGVIARMQRLEFMERNGNITNGPTQEEVSSLFRKRNRLVAKYRDLLALQRELN